MRPKPAPITSKAMLTPESVIHGQRPPQCNLLVGKPTRGYCQSKDDGRFVKCFPYTP